MAATLVSGPSIWEGQRDEEGHRTWKVTHKVLCELLDGPATAMQCPGLPIPGSIWNFGNDIDIWATCKLNRDVKQSGDKPSTMFEVTDTFSTKSDSKKCKDQQIEDPLLQPPKISGGSNRFSEEATFDRFGNAIVNSSWEQIRGPQAEFDKSKSTVNVEMNVPNLLFDYVNSMVDSVNEVELWGKAARTVKLSKFDWEKKYYGTCYYYYTWKFEFEIDARGWDRDVLDEGTKVLRGEWVRDTTSPRYTDYLPADSADPNNPADFIKFKDWNGENCRVVLNGAGLPIDTGDGTGTAFPQEAGEIHIEKYDEIDFLILGIPSTL